MKINNEKLKYYRKQAKLTQEQMSNGIGRPKITYQSYEQGVRSPKADTLSKIATILDIDVDCLLFCKDEQLKEAFKMLRTFTITISGIIKSEDINKMTLEEIAKKLESIKWR